MDTMGSSTDSRTASANEPTHAELIRVAARWLVGTRGCGVVLTERGRDEIPDAIGWRDYGRQSIVVECKVSRADFLADLRKPHRHPASSCMGSERYYLTPPGLLRPTEVPAPWGLLEWTGRIVQRRRPAQGAARDADTELSVLFSELRVYHAQGIGYLTINGRPALPHLSPAVGRDSIADDGRDALPAPETNDHSPRSPQAGRAEIEQLIDHWRCEAGIELEPRRSLLRQCADELSALLTGHENG